jgi:hypothetical protein
MPLGVNQYLSIYTDFVFFEMASYSYMGPTNQIHHTEGTRQKDASDANASKD